MTDPIIREAAQRLGIETSYEDGMGVWRDAPQSTLVLFTKILADRLQAAQDEKTEQVEVCYLPPDLKPGQPRTWGLAVQLYALRSDSNWGIGDFSDLRTLIDLLAPLGAGCVGLNPLHALFAAWPDHCCPYAPSDRRFLNPLYIDVNNVPDVAASPEFNHLKSTSAFQDRLKETRESRLVDYQSVSTLKFQALEMGWRQFRDAELESSGPSSRAQQFVDFRVSRGDYLRQFAVFEALHQTQRSEDGTAKPFPEWTDVYRDPKSDAIREFAADNKEQIGYFEYLQWLADTQIREAAAHAKAAGMSVGLYLDLALGTDAVGAEVWADPTLSVSEAELGAPPDAFSLKGQGWGLPPWNPVELAARDYRPFSDVLAAVMEHAGAVRIDHAMGLERQFWLPSGGSPVAGTYITNDGTALLDIVAQLSRSHQCLVIGEDLGTVPSGFRERLAERNILSYRVLYFERYDDGSFRDPASYPALSLATVTTHDLPTLAGFWQSRDIDTKVRLNLLPETMEEQTLRAERDRDLAAMSQLVADIGFDQNLSERPVHERHEAVIAALTRAPSRIVMVQVEDLLEVVDQCNMPGTTDEHENWCRKLPQTIDDSDFQERLELLSDVFVKAI